MDKVVISGKGNSMNVVQEKAFRDEAAWYMCMNPRLFDMSGR